jgi:hypothetical protein
MQEFLRGGEESREWEAARGEKWNERGSWVLDFDEKSLIDSINNTIVRDRKIYSTMDSGVR